MKSLIIIIGLLILGCNLSDTNSSDNSVEKELLIEEVKEIQKGVFQNGDLIFHTSLSSQSKAIQIATNSKYSHVGIIYEEEDELIVFEAIQPVKFTKLEDWIKRGENHKFVVKRLKESNKVLTDEGIEKLKNIGKKYLGKDYDLRFEWSDDKIYCSELIWKMYKEAFNIEIGKLEKISDFDLSDRIVEQKINERFGNSLNLDELIISPDRIYNSSKLRTVKLK